MVANLCLLLFTANLVRAALDSKGAMSPSSGCYAVYDALARTPGILLYPAASASAVQTLRACSPSEEPLGIWQARCSGCFQEIAPERDVLVAPHDGLHWMHIHCYFQLLGNHSPAEPLPECPSCHVNITHPFLALLNEVFYRHADVIEEDGASSHALLAVSVHSKLAADSCALLNRSLAVFKNISEFRADLEYHGDIFEVTINLTGLDSASAIISSILAHTKNASILDVYTATLTPPSQDPLANETLYTACLDRLENDEEGGILEPGTNFVYQVIAQLALDHTHCWMPDALALLGITKEPIEKRLVRTDNQMVVSIDTKTVAMITANVLTRHGAGSKPCDKQITAHISYKYTSKHLLNRFLDEGEMRQSVQTAAAAQGEIAMLRYAKKELQKRAESLPADGTLILDSSGPLEESPAEPSSAGDLQNARVVITAATLTTTVEPLIEQRPAAIEMFSHSQSYAPEYKLGTTGMSLFARLILGLAKHERLDAVGFIFAMQPFSAGLDIMIVFSEAFAKSELRRDIVARREFIDMLQSVLRFLRTRLAHSHDEKSQLAHHIAGTMDI